MNIPILMYHQIDEPPPRGTPLRGLVVRPSTFARQMRMLKLLGYRGVSMHDLEPYLSGVKQGRVVGITFDDGYQNNLIHALPELSQSGFTATCYGLSAMMGGTNSWDLGLVAGKRLMTLSDWHQWVDAGMDVGSHTRTHAKDQIASSKRELEHLLGCEVRHFCYPYGSYFIEHCAMVREAGYVTATTIRRGRNPAGADPYQLRRIMVACSTHLGLFAAKVLTGYEDRRA